jgi:hypothetical protein
LKYLDPRALRKIENLRLAARGVVEGFIAGLHRSPYHGFSVEFSEYRKYAPGDDLKHFDWKAYAKTDKAYIKQYEEETNLKAYLLLDVSSSMGYGSRDLTKLEYALLPGRVPRAPARAPAGLGGPRDVPPRDRELPAAAVGAAPPA